MDIFAHGLWAAAAARGVNRKAPRRLRVPWFAFFGVFPDLFAFSVPVTLTLWLRLTGGLGPLPGPRHMPFRDLAWQPVSDQPQPHHLRGRLRNRLAARAPPRARAARLVASHPHRHPVPLPALLRDPVPVASLRLPLQRHLLGQPLVHALQLHRAPDRLHAPLESFPPFGPHRVTWHAHPGKSRPAARLAPNIASPQGPPTPPTGRFHPACSGTPPAPAASAT